MGKSTTTNREQREARWRKLIDRQAASGRSVAAFCRDQSIPTQTFYWWRACLGRREAGATVHTDAPRMPFIDLGTVSAAGAAGNMAAGVDIRLDLPGSITLTIARR